MRTIVECLLGIAAIILVGLALVAVGPVAVAWIWGIPIAADIAVNLLFKGHI